MNMKEKILAKSGLLNGVKHEAAKARRAETVRRIVVTVDDMPFDGDEESQRRLCCAVVSALALGMDMKTDTRKWVLADGSTAYPTFCQLAQALRLAGEAQTEVWDEPYIETEGHTVHEFRQT